MNERELAPLAEVLIESYLRTGDYRHQFTEEHTFPPTLAARVHHLRAIALSKLSVIDRYELHEDYIEFGRVQVTDRDSGRTYLLRSSSAIAIEQAKRHPGQLFDDAPYAKSDVVLLVYEFHPEAMHLSTAGARRVKDRKRLEASGTPVFIAAWPYVPTDTPPFDQEDHIDPFEELGDDETEAGE